VPQTSASCARSRPAVSALAPGPQPARPHCRLLRVVPSRREGAVGVVFRCWVPTSRCRARLTPRSPPTRTRRALFGRHAAADGLRRIISSLAGVVRIAGANSILHSARMILSDVLTCTVPPLRVESSLLKNPIPPNLQQKLAKTCPPRATHAPNQSHKRTPSRVLSIMDLASARCKIYAYDVHAATGHEHLPARKHPASWSERHRYSTEIWLNQAIARHPWRVRSMRDADVIFVVSDWALLCSAGKTYTGRRLCSSL